jgi:hypothetical protein
MPTWMTKDCCDNHSGLGRLKATTTLESLIPLSSMTSNFSLLPNRLGCLREILQSKLQNSQQKNGAKLKQWSFLDLDTHAGRKAHEPRHAWSLNDRILMCDSVWHTEALVDTESHRRYY